MKRTTNIWRTLAAVFILGAVGFSAIACKTDVDTSDALKKAEAKQYSITIHDGGEGAKANPNLTAAGRIVSLSEGTKAGFILDIWEVNKPETGLMVPGSTFSMPEADVEVTAKWLKAIPVTFDYLYEGRKDTIQVGEGKSLAGGLNLERDGFMVVGWFTDVDRTIPYDFKTPVTSAFTLYAQWEEAWMVTFNYNYDNRSVKKAVLKDGRQVGKPTDTTRAGYELLGWYNEASFDTEFDFNSVITDNLTLYAQWVEVWTLTFNYNYDNKIISRQIRKGDKLEEPTDTTRAYYNFLGWYNEPALTTKFSFDTEIAEDMTLYARWILTLTENQWSYADITTEITERLYSFDVVEGTTYRIWWNDMYSGDGSKTLYAVGDASYENDNVIFNSSTSTFYNPRSFTPTSSGKIIVKIRGNNSSNFGTFGIVYSTGTTRPSLPVDLPSLANTLPLTENWWADGAITTEVTELWYSFDVVEGTNYRIWWNGSGIAGDGSKTLNPDGSAWYEDGSEIFLRSNSTFNNPSLFTPTSSGKVFIRIRGLNSTNRGTFGIVYSTGTTRPTIPVYFPSNMVSLRENQWEDGEVTSTDTERWYSFDVVEGATYRIWWNDRNRGNGLKSLRAYGDVWYENGREISITGSSTFDAPISFESTFSGKVFVKIRGQSSGTYGTFGLVYSTDNTRPAFSIPFPSNIILNENQWEDGELTAIVTERWYSFPVVAGIRYYIWWNDTDNDRPNKTVDVIASAWYDNSSVIFAASDTSNIYGEPFTPTSNGTVYVKIYPYSSGTGVFGVVYSTNSNKPALTRR